MEVTENVGGGRKARKWTQYTAALIVNLGAFTIGSLLGWTSQAAPKIRAGETEVTLTEGEFSWLAGLMPLGAAFAAVPIPFLMNTIGRKYALLLMIAPIITGFGLLACAGNVAMYFAGRFVTGMGGGAFSIVAPVYTAEIGEKKIRGSLGTYYEFMLAVGVEFSYIIGGFVSVFWLSIISALVPIVFGVAFAFMPESPYYFIAKGDRRRAEKSLKWLRGPNYDVADELTDIADSVEATMNEKLSLSHFRTKAAVRSIFIAFWLMVFQQFSGANAVVFNTTSIFQIEDVVSRDHTQPLEISPATLNAIIAPVIYDLLGRSWYIYGFFFFPFGKKKKAAGSDIKPSLASMIVGLMQFSGNFLSTVLVDRLGRRILLFASGFFMGTCTLLLGIYFHKADNNESVEHIKWLPMMSLCIFMVMFAVGWGPVAWMMLGELFPTKIKNVASSFSCAVNWIATFLVTKFFPDLVEMFGRDVTFWVFSVISGISLVFIYLFVPETKGKSLEEIQRELSGVKNTTFQGE